jgi:Caspase domain
MRRALLVGIDEYATSPLSGCVNDAKRITALLERHHDGSPNFNCRALVAPPTSINRATLRKAVEELFEGESDVALLFFAGHGTINNLGGFLVTQDAKRYDEGVALTDVLTFANNSKARERVIILDSCHSGALGQIPAISNETAVLREGVSVLSAARDTEFAMEKDGGGLFTGLVCDALAGGAADVCGKVTTASVYAYVDQALGAWQQRPLFKSHVSKLISLRSCAPDVLPEILRLLPRYFPDPTQEFLLDPSYEPDAEPDHPEHEEIFGHLQKLRATRLVEPVGEEHMYYAAMNSKSCRLTALGRFYWHLANTGKV